VLHLVHRLVGVERREAEHAFGDFIRQQRQLAKLSLRALARLSGVSDSYLSQVERGMSQPSVEVLRAVAEALKLPQATVYQRLGLLDASPTAVDVEGAIRLDPRLREPQKQALIQMYRALADRET
jgi:transcriptional regulator with XRE-family HTH domain